MARQLLVRQIGDDRAGVGTRAQQQDARGRPVPAQQVEPDRDSPNARLAAR